MAKLIITLPVVEIDNYLGPEKDREYYQNITLEEMMLPENMDNLKKWAYTKYQEALLRKQERLIPKKNV